MSWSDEPLPRPWHKYKVRWLRNAAWVEQNCYVPAGKDVGLPVRLRWFQRLFFRGIYSTVDPCRRGIFSVGRKNAKTGTSAFVVILHIAGPEAQNNRNSEIYSTAMARDQAAIVFNLAAKTIRMAPALNDYITIRETVKELHNPTLGILYKALSADAPTALGLSPALAIHDELGQVKGPRHKLYEAVETAMAAHETPLSIIISTQAPTDNDLLSILIDDAKTGKSKRTKLFLWTAPEKADPFSEETVRMANPAFGDFQNAAEVMGSADDARRMPSREAEFRNLILNQRVEADNPFCTKSVWQLSGDAPICTGPCYGGLDLSESNDLTSLELIFPEGGIFDVKSFFWLPKEGLEARSHQDRVTYDIWADDGYLLTTPGNSIEYEYVAGVIADLFAQYDIRKIAFDRWNMKHLKPWLRKAGLSDGFIDDRFVLFGQGFQSMSPAVRNLETLLLNANLRHGNHPVLTMCCANTVTKSDPAGSRKFDKARSRGRIDGMVALVMGASVASEETGKTKVFPVDKDSITE